MRHRKSPQPNEHLIYGEGRHPLGKMALSPSSSPLSSSPSQSPNGSFDRPSNDKAYRNSSATISQNQLLFGALSVGGNLHHHPIPMMKLDATSPSSLLHNSGALYTTMSGFHQNGVFPRSDGGALAGNEQTEPLDFSKKKNSSANGCSSAPSSDDEGHSNVRKSRKASVADYQRAPPSLKRSSRAHFPGVPPGSAFADPFVVNGLGCLDSALPSAFRPSDALLMSSFQNPSALCGQNPLSGPSAIGGKSSPYGLASSFAFPPMAFNLGGATAAATMAMEADAYAAFKRQIRHYQQQHRGQSAAAAAPSTQSVSLVLSSSGGNQGMALLSSALRGDDTNPLLSSSGSHSSSSHINSNGNRKSGRENSSSSSRSSSPLSYKYLPPGGAQQNSESLSISASTPTVERHAGSNGPSGGGPGSVTSSSPAEGSAGETTTTKKRGRTLPEELKDEAYWERRKKNNEAAKRSRDARRAKEDEIAIRAAFLEQENLKLRVEVASLKSETAKLRCLLYNS